MATDEVKTEGERTKPYVLYRVGANDEIIERIAEADSVEDLFKAQRAEREVCSLSSWRANLLTALGLKHAAVERFAYRYLMAVSL
jgi:hypothetical protein